MVLNTISLKTIISDTFYKKSALGDLYSGHYLPIITQIDPILMAHVKLHLQRKTCNYFFGNWLPSLFHSLFLPRPFVVCQGVAADVG